MLNQNSQIPSTDIYISQSTHSSIADLAMQLQLHYVINSGATYDVHDLQQAILQWLESSIESLVDDGMFHLVEGQKGFAFNRSEYERQLNKLQPLEPAEQTIAAA